MSFQVDYWMCATELFAIQASGYINIVYWTIKLDITTHSLRQPNINRNLGFCEKLLKPAVSENLETVTTLNSTHPVWLSATVVSCRECDCNAWRERRVTDWLTEWVNEWVSECFWWQIDLSHDAQNRPCHPCILAVIDADTAWDCRPLQSSGIRHCQLHVRVATLTVAILPNTQMFKSCSPAWLDYSAS